MSTTQSLPLKFARMIYSKEVTRTWVSQVNSFGNASLVLRKGLHRQSSCSWHFTWWGLPWILTAIANCLRHVQICSWGCSRRFRRRRPLIELRSLLQPTTTQEESFSPKAYILMDDRKRLIVSWLRTASSFRLTGGRKFQTRLMTTTATKPHERALRSARLDIT